MDNKIIYLTKNPLNVVYAVRPQTGSALIFNIMENKWDYSPIDCFQMVGDRSYENISFEQAKSVFGKVLPDERLLDRLDGIFTKI